MTPVEELDPARDAAELIVCCEVMEHLADPDAALSVVASLASALALTSCAQEDNTPDAASSPGADPCANVSTVKDGTLTVATSDPAFPPNS